MPNLKDDLRAYQKGDKKALDTPKKGEKDKTPVTTDSLKRLVQKLSPKQRDELRELIYEQELEDDLADDDDTEEEEADDE